MVIGMTDSQVIKSMEGQISGLNKDMKDMEKLLLKTSKMDKVLRSILRDDEIDEERILEIAMVMGE